MNVRPTDTSVLTLLEQFGPMGTADLAGRLERTGHVQRTRQDKDRRRIVVRSTLTAHRVRLAVLLPVIDFTSTALPAIALSAR